MLNINFCKGITFVIILHYFCIYITKYKAMNNLTELSKTIHKGNVDKGFYDVPKETGTTLMLVVSELGEALEADRHGLMADRITFEQELIRGNDFRDSFRNCIKDRYEDEIADAIIRLLDHCGHMNIDIEFHVKHKLMYNATRDRLHGKKY